MVPVRSLRPVRHHRISCSTGAVFYRPVPRIKDLLKREDGGRQERE